MVIHAILYLYMYMELIGLVIHVLLYIEHGEQGSTHCDHSKNLVFVWKFSETERYGDDHTV